MNIRAFNSWIASFGLHILFIAAIAITWKPQSLSNNDPSISVDIISSFASGEGPETKIDTQTTDIAPSEDLSPATTEEVAPLEPNIEAEAIELKKPLPQAMPEKKIAQAQPTKIPQKSEPLLNRLEKLVQKQPQTQPIAKPSPKKPNKELDYQFDLAAATKASSGVNSGGVKTPKLSKSGIVAKGKSQGGGAKLQGDLLGALRDQVKPCWAEPADLSDPQSLKVEVKMELLPDGNLAKPPKLVYPASKSGASASVLVAIDNAMRAAKQCAPYVLPSERYAEWQSFSFNFDPKILRQK